MASIDRSAGPSDTSFGGHPAALSTLFFTEMWERFSYYGMRALLILFMTTATLEGGLGFDMATAGAIYGLYTAGVYLLALPGGFLADRLLGRRRAVLYGGVLISIGHFTLAVPSQTFFFLGLIFVALGTGLLKPNVSMLVGDLYDDDARRDAGFSLFYMGINLGGFAAPLVCGILGEKVGWHWGFAAAGIGMLAGLAQLMLGRDRLGSLGVDLPVPVSAQEQSRIRRRTFGVLAFSALVGVGFFAGWIPWTAVQLANGTTAVVLAVVAGYFAYILTNGGLQADEHRRVAAIAVLFAFSTLFWLGFEQGGSSLSIFARDMTDRVVAGWEIPASWFQSVNSLCVILLVPVFAALWLRLGSRQPSVPIKFAMGLILMGSGFALLAFAAQGAASGRSAHLGWLVVAYLLHTCGELCLSPVGLSAVSRLSPAHLGGQMMGVWFISIALGNLIAGLVAGRIAAETMAPTFGAVALLAAAGGLAVGGLSGVLTRWMGQSSDPDTDGHGPEGVEAVASAPG